MQTYDPSSIVFTFAGLQITGFANETYVQVTRNADAYTGIVGADGEFARARMRDQSGLVTLTLLQTSPGNDLLNTKAAQDEVSNLGFGTLFITDLLGNELVSSAEAYIQKRADINYDVEITTREWVFWCGQLIVQNGGTVDVPFF